MLSHLAYNFNSIPSFESSVHVDPDQLASNKRFFLNPYELYLQNTQLD